MDITKIWMSQRKLRNLGQVPLMIRELNEGNTLPPISLAMCEDGEVQLEDGHHRLTAIWLNGRQELLEHEYVLVEKDQWKPRFGRIADFVQRLDMGDCQRGQLGLTVNQVT